MHVEHIDNGDRTSASRKLNIEETKGKGRGIKTWNKCVKVDMKRLSI